MPMRRSVRQRNWVEKGEGCSTPHRTSRLSRVPCLLIGGSDPELA